MKRLSSVAVPLIKGLPFVMAGLGVVLLFRGFDSLNAVELCILFGGGAIVAHVTRKWKSVFLEGGLLHIASFRESLAVPLVHIARIQIISASRIRLTFHPQTAFEREIIFVTRRLGFKTPEIAAELSQRINHARTFQTSRPAPRYSKRQSRRSA